MIEKIDGLHDVGSLSAAFVDQIAKMLVGFQTSYTDTIYKTHDFSVISTIEISEKPSDNDDIRNFMVHIRSVAHVLTEVITSVENLINIEFLSIPVSLTQMTRNVLYDYPVDTIDTYSENILSMLHERFNTIYN